MIATPVVSSIQPLWLAYHLAQPVKTVTTIVAGSARRIRNRLASSAARRLIVVRAVACPMRISVFDCECQKQTPIQGIRAPGFGLGGRLSGLRLWPFYSRAS